MTGHAQIFLFLQATVAGVSFGTKHLSTFLEPNHEASIP